jgi:sulfur carrier protein ThiS
MGVRLLKVTLVSVADLREYFGREPVGIELPEDATINSLLQVIAQRWGSQLPAYMWDSNRCGFRGPILLLVNQKVVRDHSTALCDGQEVTVMHALAGG